MANGNGPDQDSGFRRNPTPGPRPEGREFLRLVEERERLLKKMGGSDVFSDVVLAQIRQLRPDQAVKFLRLNMDDPQRLRWATPPGRMLFRGDRVRTTAQKTKDLQQLLRVQAATAGGAARDASNQPGRGEPQGVMAGLGDILRAFMERDQRIQQEMDEAGAQRGLGALEWLMPTPGGAAAGAARGRSALGVVDDLPMDETLLRAIGAKAKQGAAPGSWMDELPVEVAGRLRQLMHEAAKQRAHAGPARRRLEGIRDVIERVMGGPVGLGGPQRSGSRSAELLLDNLLGVPIEAARTEFARTAMDQGVKELKRLLERFVNNGEGSQGEGQ